MRTIETAVYTYDELSPAAQERAQAWFRSLDDGDEFWSERVIDDATALLNLMGFSDVKIFFSGFSCQGDGASFSADYAYRPDAPARVREEAPNRPWSKFALQLQNAQHSVDDLLSCRITTSGHHCHEYSMDFAWEYDGEDERDTPAAEKSMEETMRDMARHIYRTLEEEWDYQNEPETLAESIRANEYTFTAEGKRFG